MASIMPNTIEETFVQCCLCLKELQSPRLLPCLHAFCTSCLQRYIEERQTTTAVNGAASSGSPPQQQQQQHSKNGAGVAEEDAPKVKEVYYWNQEAIQGHNQRKNQGQGHKKGHGSGLRRSKVITGRPPKKTKPNRNESYRRSVSSGSEFNTHEERDREKDTIQEDPSRELLQSTSLDEDAFKNFAGFQKSGHRKKSVQEICNFYEQKEKQARTLARMKKVSLYDRQNVAVLSMPLRSVSFTDTGEVSTPETECNDDDDAEACERELKDEGEEIRPNLNDSSPIHLGQSSAIAELCRQSQSVCEDAPMAVFKPFVRVDPPPSKDPWASHRGRPLPPTPKLPAAAVTQSSTPDSPDPTVFPSFAPLQSPSSLKPITEEVPRDNLYEEYNPSASAGKNAQSHPTIATPVLGPFPSKDLPVTTTKSSPCDNGQGKKRPSMLQVSPSGGGGKENQTRRSPSGDEHLYCEILENPAVSAQASTVSLALPTPVQRRRTRISSTSSDLYYLAGQIGIPDTPTSPKSVYVSPSALDRRAPRFSRQFSNDYRAKSRTLLRGLSLLEDEEYIQLDDSRRRGASPRQPDAVLRRQSGAPRPSLEGTSADNKHLSSTYITMDDMQSCHHHQQQHQHPGEQKCHLHDILAVPRRLSSHVKDPAARASRDSGYSSPPNKIMHQYLTTMYHSSRNHSSSMEGSENGDLDLDTMIPIYDLAKSDLSENSPEKKDGRAGAAMSEPQTGVPCPKCAKRFQLPAQGVEGLQRCSFLSRLKDVVSMQKVEQKECARCESKSAKHRCLTCCQNLCPCCQDMHREDKTNKDHRVVTLSEMQSGRYQEDVQRSQVVVCDCDVDGRKEVEVFCVECNRPLCSSCFLSHASNHTRAAIATAAQRDVDSLQDLKNTVSGRIEIFKGAIENFEDYKIHCARQESGRFDDINFYREMMHRLVDECFDVMCQKTQAEYSAEINRTDRLSQAAAGLVNEMNHNCYFASQLLTHGKEAEVVAMATKLRGNLTQYKEASPEYPRSQLELQYNPVDVVTSQLRPFCGQVTVRHAPISTRASVTAGPSMASSPEVNHHTVLSLKQVKVFSAKTGQDKKGCKPTGMAVTPHNHVVLIDDINKKLKIFDLQGDVKSEVCPYPPLVDPWDVAVLPHSGNLIVTDRGTKSAKLFRSSGELLSLFGAHLRSPWGVAVNSRGDIFITDSTAKAVFVHSCDGKLKCSLPRDCDKPLLANCLQCPEYVCINSNDDIIVSDVESHCVVVFDSLGRFLYKYGNQGKGTGQLSVPCGVTTDMEGNILIAEYENRRVTKISRNGKFISFLLTQKDGLQKPQTLQIDYQGHLVVVDGADVKVFSLPGQEHCRQGSLPDMVAASSSESLESPNLSPSKEPPMDKSIMSSTDSIKEPDVSSINEQPSMDTFVASLTDSTMEPKVSTSPTKEHPPMDSSDTSLTDSMTEPKATKSSTNKRSPKDISAESLADSTQEPKSTKASSKKRPPKDSSAANLTDSTKEPKATKSSTKKRSAKNTSVASLTDSTKEPKATKSSSKKRPSKDTSAASLTDAMRELCASASPTKNHAPMDTSASSLTDSLTEPDTSASDAQPKTDTSMSSLTDCLTEPDMSASDSQPAPDTSTPSLREYMTESMTEPDSSPSKEQPVNWETTV